MAKPWEMYGPEPPKKPTPKAAPVTPARRKAAQESYKGIENRLATRIANMPASQQAEARKAFAASAGTKQLRAMAGLPAVTTRNEEIQSIARSRLGSKAGKKADASMGDSIARGVSAFSPFLGSMVKGALPDEKAAAFGAGVEQGAFGLPTRLRAGVNYLQDMISGKDADYGRSFDIETAENRMRQERAPGTALAGNLVGGVGSGIGVTRGVAAAGTRLAASAAPAAAKVGNVIQRATTLRRGERVKNTVKVVGAGTAAGTAQALGEGSDVMTGAAIGAAAPIVLGGGVKLIQGASSVIRQGTRPFSSSIPKAIREVIKQDPAEIAARQAALSNQVGGNVPVIAALNDQDFKAVTDKVLKRSPDALEAAKSNTGQYIRSFMDRMLRHVNDAGKAGDAQNTNIGDLAQLRKDTGDDLMRPIADRQLDLTQLPLDDLERQITRQIGGRIQGLAPRINEALKDLSPDQLDELGLDASDVAAARKLITDWGLGTPVQVTVREMDSLRRALQAASKGSMTSNPANAMAYRNAAQSVRDFVESEVPAYGQMVDTFAAQSRMMEGFKTAAAGKRITDIEDDLLRNNLRTAEGHVGLKAGELYRQREAVTGKPTQAIASARDFAAQGRLTRQPSMEPDAAQPGTVTENLGEVPSARLADASQGETAVMGRMIDTDRLAAISRNEDGAISPEEIAYGALLGNALASTQARFVARLLDKFPTGMNEKVATRISNMLFSQDAAMSREALDALRRAGMLETEVSRLMSRALPASFAAGQVAALEKGLDEPVRPERAQNSPGLGTQVEGQTEPGPWDDYADDGREMGDSPYTSQLQELFENESPELVDLIERVAQQESGGQQFRPDGSPVTSSAGAIGVMQVMPGTAPEAAALAGVAFDDNAYRNDPAYNQLIGIAYLSEMLRRYDGDVDLALAAYNAGPGAVDQSLQQGDNWLASLPAETQDYVTRINS